MSSRPGLGTQEVPARRPASCRDRARAHTGVSHPRPLSATLAAAVLALCLLLAHPLPALALQIHREEDVQVPAGTTVADDVAIDGVLVRIDGHVQGDVYVVGQLVSVRGEIDGDLIGLAQDVEIDGPVHGSVRVASPGRVVVDAPVGGSVSAAAPEVTVTGHGPIGGALTAAAGGLSVGAPVGRGAAFLATDALVDAPVGGGVLASVDRLRFGPGARVAGDVEYWSSRDAQTEVGAQLGRLVRHDRQAAQLGPQMRQVLATAGWVLSIAWLVGMLVASTLLFALAPHLAAASRDALAAQPAALGLLGLAALVLAPPIAFLLGLTLVGLPLALVVAALWGLGLVGGPVLLAGGLGALGVRRIARPIHPALPAAVCLVLLWLLTLLPYVGGLVTLVVLAFGLGLLLSRAALLVGNRPVESG